MRLVFVMDPVSTVLVDADTTFALMLAAQARGHRVDHCLGRDVGLAGGRPTAVVRRASLKRDQAQPISLGPAESVCLDDVNLVFVRRDPPFDMTYLWLTQILDLLEEKTPVVNSPRGLRDANEKLYVTRFPELAPRMIISAEKSEIRAFLRELGAPGVIKPIDGHGGSRVFKLDERDPNFNACVETITDEGRRVAMIQEYLPAVSIGDKRILLLDGEPLGAILRVPQGGDLRSNIHVGGKVVSATLDEADRHIVETVATRLRADGLFFVGLDVIGGKLTEVNVTSPTGIQQMSRLDGVDYSERVIDWLERRAS
jgi:glutathione synthase